MLSATRHRLGRQRVARHRAEEQLTIRIVVEGERRRRGRAHDDAGVHQLVEHLEGDERRGRADDRVDVRCSSCSIPARASSTACLRWRSPTARAGRARRRTSLISRTPTLTALIPARPIWLPGPVSGSSVPIVEHSVRSWPAGDEVAVGGGGLGSSGADVRWCCGVAAPPPSVPSAARRSRRDQQRGDDASPALHAYASGPSVANPRASARRATQAPAVA